MQKLQMVSDYSSDYSKMVFHELRSCLYIFQCAFSQTTSLFRKSLTTFNLSAGFIPHKTVTKADEQTYSCKTGRTTVSP